MSKTIQDEILAQLSNDRRAKVAITDIDGVLRGKYIHIDKLKSAMKGGFGFCDVVLGWDIADQCYDNAAFTGWHSGYPDAEVRLDMNTFRRVPWDDSVPFFLGDFVNSDETPLAVCPRQLLKKVVQRAASMGLAAKFGVEFEWFNFRETPQSLADKSHVNPTPITPGMFGYSVLRSSLNSGFFRDIMEMLEAFGVPVEGLHTETGPGVVEAAIANTTPLEAADRAVLFKSGVKEIAYRHGMIATFMAKWNEELPGSSGHLHQSLWNEAGENVFFDPAHPHGMSATFESYIAGQLKLLPAILPMLAPTVNSFKRLVEGMWAPTRLTWAIDNRTVALRVIPGSPKSTRLELRVGGADLNPYLGIAAALAAGLYGIENNLKLEHEPIVGNGYEAEAEHLPRDLDGAADQLDSSNEARELFGDAFVDHFVQSRRWEARQYRTAVTDWELKRYFELV